MTPDQARATYRRMMAAEGETVTLRRYSGTGAGRVYTDYAGLRARVVAFQAHELVAGVVQGDRMVILLAEDVADQGVVLPIASGGADRLIVRGKELSIKAVDDNTRRVAGEVIAYDVKIGG